MFPVVLKSSDKSDRVLFAKENLNVRSEDWLEAIACDELNLWYVVYALWCNLYMFLG
jgi:hypothetical protein